MSTHFKPYRSGQVYGTLYTFDAVGDGLPEHHHADIELHNIVVLQGAVDFIQGWAVSRLVQGDVFDFDGTRKHLVIAREPGTRLLNLFLNGRPAAYDAIDPAEFTGQIEVHNPKGM